MEEIADVLVCIDLIHPIDWDKVQENMQFKFQRWGDRLEEEAKRRESQC